MFGTAEIIKRCDVYADKADFEGRYTEANTFYMAARELERLQRELTDVIEWGGWVTIRMSSSGQEWEQA